MGKGWYRTGVMVEKMTMMEEDIPIVDSLGFRCPPQGVAFIGSLVIAPHKMKCLFQFDPSIYLSSKLIL